MISRTAGVALTALSLVYLWFAVPHGWIPHDEGMIGQSAERVLAGGVPHVDYEEPYTGGLTLLHAAAFKVLGVNLLYPRWLLFAGAILAQAITFVVLRRYLGPLGAALGAWIALGWSFPNYFAALPSWWVLICALACVWAFTRYVETGWLRYAAAAGVAAGASILIKQTGLYVLVALVMALLYCEPGRERGTAGWRLLRLACVGTSLAALALALAVLRTRLALTEVLYLLLPIAACSMLLLKDGGGIDDRSSGSRGFLLAPATALAAAAVPLLCFVAPYIFNGQIHTLLNGLFILPQKRLQFASMGMPSPEWLIAGVPVVVAVMKFPQLRRSSAVTDPRVAATAAGLVGVVLGLLSVYDRTSYQLTWHSIRGFAALLPIVSCWLIFSGRIEDPKQRGILFGFVSMLAWASLVQFPFGAPIYFCYTTPLIVIAAVVTAGNTGALRRTLVGGLAALLLVFSLAVMNRGYVYNLGQEYLSYDAGTALDLPRADLFVGGDDAATYRRVVELVRFYRVSGNLVAGPDCPEVYFLTGQFSPSGTLFDFFATDESETKGLQALPGWTDAEVVVMNHRPIFSPRLTTRAIRRIRRMFPNMEEVGPFEVRWR